MPLTFQDVLRNESVDPETIHLVRHQDRRGTRGRTLYSMWRTAREEFELYQKIQAKPVFREGNLIASFVAPPTSDTLFAGLYRVQGVGLAPAGMCDPVGGHSVSGYSLYDLVLDQRLSGYVGKLVIDWGLGYRSWAQRAHSQPKPILELRREICEPSFPGYLQFMRPLSQIEALPESWMDRLREAKGVYLITCPRTREQYVGSAAGTGGFYERWLQHATKEGDAVKFRSRDPSDYQVSILEVAGTAACHSDILNSEQLWMRKLQSTEMGLNASAGYTQSYPPRRPTETSRPRSPQLSGL